MRFSELIELDVELAGGRYSSEVSLEEEALDGSGQLNISLSLEALGDSELLAGPGSAAAPPAPSGAFALQPTIPVAFMLRLRLTKASADAVAKAAEEGERQRLRLRCEGVEQPLGEDEVCLTLVLVDSWAEVSHALGELDICVQEGDARELRLDISPLCEASSVHAGAPGGTDGVSATISTTGALTAQEAKLSFAASVQSLRWSSAKSQLEAGRSKYTEIFLRGSEVNGQRTWRLSFELHSLRITGCASANAFATYIYEPLKQPRPFRTNPPALARRNTTVYLQHGYAAYTLRTSRAELGALLEDPLRVEVWHRDAYKKDSLLGFVDASLAPVFDEPLQYSPSMPSMVHGYRVLDQACPVIGVCSEGSLGQARSADGGAGPATLAPGKVGMLRVRVFLEDLGAAATDVAVDHRPAPTAVGSASTSVPKMGTISAESAPSPAVMADCVEQSNPLISRHPALTTGSGGGESLQALRNSPAYACAYELELWKRAEQEQFQARLAEQLATAKSGFEEEYRQKELSRARDFRLKQQELREVEAKVRKKLQELQQREVTLVADESRVAAMRDEARQRADLTVRECEDAARRQVAEAQHALKLEKDRSQHLSSRQVELEAELASAKKRCQDLEEELAAEAKRRREEVLEAGGGAAAAAAKSETAAALLRSQEELQHTKLQLADAERRAEALGASRDHFRQKVEELCRRLPQVLDSSKLVSGPTRALGSFASPLGVEPGSSAQANSTTPLPSADLAPAANKGVARALRVIQDDLAKLAREWDSQEPATLEVPDSRSGTSSAMAPPTGSSGTQQHLVWLKNQRSELLQSGLYTESDSVVVAIDAKIAQATAKGIE